MSGNTPKTTRKTLAKLAATSFVAASLFGGGQAVAAKSNVLFILDSSNSMNAHVGGIPKYQVAKGALTRFVDQMPSGIKMGLASFGHRFSHKIKECENDMELFVGVGGLNRSEIRTLTDYAKPKGQTPIAQTLMQVPRWLEQQTGQNNTVVLVSDGVESCSGDPCAAAAALNDIGITTKIHVVGFDLTAEQRAKIQCISDNGNGKYFDARDSSELVAALDQVQAEVVTPQPIKIAVTPPKPKLPPAPKVYFRDDFDGEALGAHWTVNNEDPEGYIVEDGGLTVLFSDSKKPTNKLKDAKNIFRLNKPIPKGNWSMTTRFEFKPQTHGEWLRAGLSKEDGTNLFASLATHVVNYVTSNLQLRVDKTAKGKVTSFRNTITAAGDRDITARSQKFAQMIKGYQLRLTRKGRKYIASARLEAASPEARKEVDESWKVISSVASLRAPGDAFTLMFGNAHTHPSLPHDGEGIATVDWVEIVSQN